MGLAAIVMAMGSFTSVFKKTYDLDAKSKVAAAGCLTCHEKKSGGKLNAYGTDLQKAMKGSKKLTPEMLHAIDKLDSNKNGKSNADDIKAGNLP